MIDPHASTVDAVQEGDSTHGVLRSPVFLVGSERSGTTLLRLMLDHHPRIRFHHEFELAVDFLPGSGWPDMAEYHRWLGTDRVFRDGGYTIDPSLDYPRLVDGFLRQYRKGSGKTVIGATVHSRFHELPRIWPDARFIHIVRDGRDVARSVVAIGWEGNAWHAAERWLVAEQRWDRLRATLTPDRFAEVKYEELVADAAGTLRRLCPFLGVEFDPVMFDYAGNSTYEMPDPKLIGQWRGKMDKRDVQRVEARVGEMLVRRGYEPSGLPRITLSPFAQWRLLQRSRVNRAIFRLKRYGLPLFCQELAARRMGLVAWHRRLRLHIDRIDEVWIK